jgi:RAD54-like protein 2
LYILNETSKKLIQRIKIVQNWSQTGGTLLIGYEMFRLMVTKKSSPTSTSTKTNNNNNNKIPNASSPITPLTIDPEEEEKNFETLEGKNKFLFIKTKNLFFNVDIRDALINPDLVICDEGHRIKNHQAGVAIALKSIRTQYKHLKCI